MEELLYEKWLLCKARIGYKAKSKRITGLIIKNCKLFRMGHNSKSVLQSRKNNMESTLIISGGGNRGSWGAGFSKGLVESGKEYQIVGGTSAGALITSSVILNQFKKLETLFNRINNRDVYNFNPFRSNGGIRVFKSLLRILFGYPSIGESKNLRKLIEEIFTEEDYKTILKQQKTVFCVTTSLNTSKRSIKSTNLSSYTDMLDWIWASASVPILTKPVKKEN